MITGASTGIGRACALRLDRMGFRVFAGVREEADGEALAEGASEVLTPIVLDVEDEASVLRAVETVSSTVAEGAGLWGLVNNAGTTVTGPLEFVPLAEFRRQLEVNLVGQLAVAQAFLPLIRRAGGRIVNMGSFNGLVSAPFIGPYCASKFGLEALTDTLRLELRPWGVSVSLIEPGSVRTPIWRKYGVYTDKLLGSLPEEALGLYGRAISAARAAAERRSESGIPPEAVANAVAHALTAKRPRTRYLVGLDARVGAVMAKVLPDRLMDELTARYMKLPKEPG